ncbi:hypothetical protein HAX54_039645, partial [Datura stramonium]|nr:hypothetical protein [Datura stramonium]
SLSVLSGDEVVFKKEFQTDRRSLQVASKMHVEKAAISMREVTQPRSPNKEIQLLEDSYSLKGPETVYDNTYDKLVDDILRCRLCIRQCKANVERLNLKESNIKLEISNLR